MNGNRVLTASEDSTLRIWDRENGNCLKILTGHTDSIQGIMQLPDGQVASWSGDATIRLWDVDTGYIKEVLSGHNDYILGALLLPSQSTSDQRLLSWSFDGTIRVWDTIKGHCISTFHGGGGRVSDVLLMADGNILYRSKDGALRTWDLVSTQALQSWSLKTVAKDAPQIWEAYQNRHSKPKKILWKKEQTSLVLKLDETKAYWQGDGSWNTRHSIGDTMLATNDKHLVFLQLYKGKNRIMGLQRAANI